MQQEPKPAEAPAFQSEAGEGAGNDYAGAGAAYAGAYVGGFGFGWNFGGRKFEDTTDEEPKSSGEGGYSSGDYSYSYDQEYKKQRMSEDDESAETMMDDDDSSIASDISALTEPGDEQLEPEEELAHEWFEDFVVRQAGEPLEFWEAFLDARKVREWVNSRLWEESERERFGYIFDFSASKRQKTSDGPLGMMLDGVDKGLPGGVHPSDYFYHHAVSNLNPIEPSMRRLAVARIHSEFRVRERLEVFVRALFWYTCLEGIADVEFAEAVESRDEVQMLDLLDKWVALRDVASRAGPVDALADIAKRQAPMPIWTWEEVLSGVDVAWKRRLGSLLREHVATVVEQMDESLEQYREERMREAALSRKERRKRRKRRQ